MNIFEKFPEKKGTYRQQYSGKMSKEKYQNYPCRNLWFTLLHYD